MYSSRLMSYEERAPPQKDGTCSVDRAQHRVPGRGGGFLASSAVCLLCVARKQMLSDKDISGSRAKEIRN